VTTTTEKGKFVSEHGVQISFPFELTRTTVEDQYGRFKNPPSTNSLEKDLQTYFINQCKQLQKLVESKLVVEDVHSFPLLATRKPDFVFIAKGRLLDSLNVVAVGEIKQYVEKKFSNADVGQAVSFGEKVLQLQPRRAHIYVILTDCRHICIYKVTRRNYNSDNIRFSYEFVSPEILNFDKKIPPDGWRYLVTIMECDQESLGWVEPSLKFNSDTVKLVRSISTGRTSVVYEGKLNDMETVVVKLAKEEKYLGCFERERSVLENLDSPHIPKLRLYDQKTLVTTPLGTKVTELQKADIRDIIETLRIAHSQNIVHMDLRRYNFIRGEDGKILIIDWGYSGTKDERGTFAGAVECMPDDVLSSLVNNEGQIIYSPRIDLICLVRSFFLILHKSLKDRIPFDGVCDFKEKANEALNFWSTYTVSDFWKRAYNEANNVNYDNLIRVLEALSF
jgi:predicted Ser/Thr protein kinase